MSSVATALAALDFQADANAIPDGYLLADAVVVMRLVHGETGRESMFIALNEGCSGIVSVGLLAHGLAALNRVEAE